MLDSETPSAPGSPQHAFAAADLRAVNRSVTPWIVVGCAGASAAAGERWPPASGIVLAAAATPTHPTPPPAAPSLHRMMAAPSSDTRPVVGDIANMQRLQADYEDLFLEGGVRAAGARVRVLPLACGARQAAAQRESRAGSVRCACALAGVKPS